MSHYIRICENQKHPAYVAQGLHAKIEERALYIPPVFDMIQSMGGINKRTMFNTCNMGIGMVLAVVKEDDGDAGMHIQHNPNGSAAAIEGITTRDGRISGKMTHAGRAGRGLYQNIPGNYQLPLFASAVKYFQ